MRSVRYLPAVLATGALLTAGCATGGTPPTSTAATTPASSTSASPTTTGPGTSGNPPTSAGPTPIGRPAHGYLASEADKGHTVTLNVGDELVIELHSTYWIFDQPSPASVLTVEHPPAVSGQPPSSERCVPGGGCGTVRVVYRAIAPGTATAAANRNSCGEAMACAEEQAHYRLTVVVH